MGPEVVEAVLADPAEYKLSARDVENFKIYKDVVEQDEGVFDEQEGCLYCTLKDLLSACSVDPTTAGTI
jgi:hypothetical protein